MPKPAAEDIVRTELANGKTLEEIAAHLIAVGVRPIPAIKALRQVCGIPLGEAKTLIDRNLSPEEQETNERIRDMVESIALFAQAVSEARCTASGCPAEAEAFVVYLVDPGQGLHTVAPLTLAGFCERHRDVLRRDAFASSFGWLEPGVVLADEVDDLLDWFYGASGLSVGPRGISVILPPDQTHLR
jgi:hypothetical protein